MFKRIKNLETYGVIDEYGNVKSLVSDIIRKAHKDKSSQWCITINGNRYRVKKLVAQTFIRDYNPDEEEVVYVDGNPDNLHFSNLKIEPKQVRFKLTQEDADLIKSMAKGGYKQSALAKKFGVSRVAISQIVNGIIWNH